MPHSQVQKVNMSDMHNLQIVISQSPVLNRLNEGPLNAAANGAQILNIAEQRKVERKQKSVREADEAAKTEREEAKKRRLKKASKQLIDLYG